MAMMKGPTSTILLLYLLPVLLSSSSNQPWRFFTAIAFAPAIPHHRRHPGRAVNRRSSFWGMMIHPSTPTTNDAATEPSPIGKDFFVNAVAVLEAEIARQWQEATGIAATTPPTPATSPSDTDYAMAKLRVSLSIVGNPGLDLTEVAGLVLVTGVESNAVDAGLKLRDTIVHVATSDGSYQQDCAMASLDDMSEWLQTAVSYALPEQGGSGSIDLVLNRLLPIAYIDENEEEETTPVPQQY